MYVVEKLGRGLIAIDFEKKNKWRKNVRHFRHHGENGEKIDSENGEKIDGENGDFFRHGENREKKNWEWR